MTGFPTPTGCDGLDEKRARIPLALARCKELSDGGLTGAPLASLISDALDYIEALLRYEETLLTGWQGAAEHVALHDRWRDEARKKAKTAGSRQGAREFFAFADQWWAAHDRRDLEYSRHVACD